MDIGLQGCSPPKKVVTLERSSSPRSSKSCSVRLPTERPCAEPVSRVTVELAGDIAQPRRRRQHIAVAEVVAIAVGQLRADEPAVVVRGRPLAGARLFSTSRSDLLAGPAALQGEVEELRGPFEAAVAAAEHVIGSTFCEPSSTDNAPAPPPMKAPTSQFGCTRRSMPMAPPQAVEVARKVSVSRPGCAGRQNCWPTP